MQPALDGAAGHGPGGAHALAPALLAFIVTWRRAQSSAVGVLRVSAAAALAVSSDASGPGVGCGGAGASPPAALAAGAQQARAQHPAHWGSFTARIDGLAPGAAYVVRVVPAYDDGFIGPASDMSLPMHTLAFQPPAAPGPPRACAAAPGSAATASFNSICMEWDAPLLNTGGAPLLGYTVYSRRSEPLGDARPDQRAAAQLGQPEPDALPSRLSAAAQPLRVAATAPAAAAPAATVHDLPLFAAFEFGVVAHSAAGDSVMSALSPPLRPAQLPPPRRGAAPHLDVHLTGSPVAHGVLVAHSHHSGAACHHDSTPCLGRVATICDVSQSVTLDPVSAGQAPDVIAVWAGHWSPRNRVVQAELVLADPVDGVRELANAAGAAGRIVVMERGGASLMSKVRHAQLAGALAVIIMDVSGACDAGYDEHCFAGASQTRAEHWGDYDPPALWDGVDLPAVLASRALSVHIRARLVAPSPRQRAQLKIPLPP